MHRLPRGAFAFALLAVSIGCYHATIETGASPSAEVINKSFASGWIFGLVPPSTVSTAAKCPAGAAKVETQLSFVNQLVSLLTLGIYTPMAIKVTCAAASPGSASRPTPAERSAPLAKPEAVPPGMNWIASVSQKLYYRATCAAGLKLPEADRLYFADEETATNAGFKRSVAC
jgi:Bor protein